MSPLLAVIDFLCFLTSSICAVLLLRRHRQLRLPLLLSTSLCFIFLAINNGLLFVDNIMLPTIDLSILRQATNLLAVGLLVAGFVWDLG